MQADIQPGDTVAVWGFGPVGQMTIRSAILLGAEQVVASDHLPERLSTAAAAGAVTIDFAKESMVERLSELTGGSASTRSARRATSISASSTRCLIAPSRC